MSSSTKSANHPAQLNKQEQRLQRQTVAAAMRSSATFVFVPRYVPQQQQIEDGMGNIIPTPLPGNCKDEERAFLQNFDEHVLSLISQLRRHFPYRQTIQWSIEYGDDNEHNLEILVQPRRSMSDC